MAHKLNSSGMLMSCGLLQLECGTHATSCYVRKEQPSITSQDDSIQACSKKHDFLVVVVSGTNHCLVLCVCLIFFSRSMVPDPFNGGC